MKNVIVSKGSNIHEGYYIDLDECETLEGESNIMFITSKGTHVLSSEKDGEVRYRVMDTKPAISKWMIENDYSDKIRPEISEHTKL